MAFGSVPPPFCSNYFQKSLRGKSDRLLGEAKIYSSPSYHIKGISQLLGRYTTGNETQGLMISYVRKKDIKGITAKLKTALNEQRPEGQIEPCGDHTLKWSIVTKHQHSSGEVLPLSHIGCNLHDA
ncbi:MAG: hypothetical protein IH623_06045 [Verrucomicrobia bacterium]|nr:hypothetical protein [Verrucomicrobiota bacterium]